MEIGAPIYGLFSKQLTAKNQPKPIFTLPKAFDYHLSEIRNQPS